MSTAVDTGSARSQLTFRGPSPPETAFQAEQKVQAETERIKDALVSASSAASRVSPQRLSLACGKYSVLLSTIPPHLPLSR